MATLAFGGRREAFFTKQLMAALQIVEQGHITSKQLKGSWAGAMGQSQFMPTSFLAYGADGDGKIDIWSNIDDVFASIANYLSTVGWKTNMRWGYEVQLPSGFSADQVGLKDHQAQTVARWQQQGVRLPDSRALSSTALASRSWVITPDGMQGRAFLVYSNFRTLMSWNRSYYFVISVCKMVDSINLGSE